MKKVILYALTMCAMLIVTACGGSDNSGGDNNETGYATYATYKEALAANDFEAAHKIITQAEADLAKCQSASGKRSALDKAFNGKSERRILEQEFAEKYGFQAYERDLKKVKEEIFDKEVKFLAANGSTDAIARLVFLFSDFQIEGKKLPRGLNSYYDAYNNIYPQSVNEYNSKLDMVLDLAISQENKELAQKIIKLYKENVDVFKGGSGHSKKENDRTRYFEIAPDGTEVDGNHCYVTYNWKDKEAAKKKYEENFGGSKETDE